VRGRSVRLGLGRNLANAGAGRAARGVRWAAVLAVALACAPLACAREDASSAPESEPSAQAADAAPAFVGGAVCAGCHAEQAAAWRDSHHDLAMQEAREDTVLGDFEEARFTHHGVESRFFRREGRFVVETTGAQGAPVEVDVAYTFGADPLQQYLVRGERGRLQALGLAWDARPAERGGQRWLQLFPDARPGDPLHWTGLDQTWNAMCAECHSTHLEKRYDPGDDRYATRWADLDVACEACHGPGSRHVARARGESAAGGELPVRFEGRGSWELAPGAATARLREPRVADAEMDACGRCHARRGAITEEYDYGRPLLDTHRPALLDEGLYFADGQIQGEVYVWGSFLQSRMYASGVACSDCHDPHSLRIEEPDATCARCHESEAFAVPAHHHHAQGSAGASCVECHMPARTYMEVDPRRDHSFRVPRPDLSVALGTPNACNGCHGDRDAAWAEAALRRWFPEGRSGTSHFAEALDAGRRGALGASVALGDLAGDASQPAIARATALRLLAHLPGADALRGVRTGAGDASGLVRMAAAETGRVLSPGTALQHLGPLLRDPRLAVRTQAASALADLPPRLWSAAERAAHADALAELRAAQRANADRPEAQVNLGSLHARMGELREAERAYRVALRLDPTFYPAAVNLADVYRAQEREDEAERVLREALEQSPDAADLHHALGLAWVRQGRRDEALVALRRAAEGAPDAWRHFYVYGLALHESGETERGLAVLRAAHDRHPTSRAILVALATLRRDAGDREAALRHARALLALDPGDPDARALISELEEARAD